MNLNANKQTDKPSTSRESIDRDNPRYDSNVSEEKPGTLSSFSRAFSGDENDDAIHSPSDIKVRTWIHSVIDIPEDNWIAGNEIEEKARPMNPISDDNGKSDGTGEVYYDASRRPSQDKKQNTDCPERVDEDNRSQMNKGARRIGEVIEIDSAASAGLKYNASHARIRAKESREKIARSRSDIEETVSQDNSSSTTVHDGTDRIATSAPSSLSATSSSAITEQSTANWSRVIEFGKEMKRGRKRKIKKLNVSTEKKKKALRIIENVRLSPSSSRTLLGYASAKTATTCDKSEKETNVSNRSESNERKQDEIDKGLDLSDTKVKSLRENQIESHNKDKNDSLKSISTMNSSYIMLEEGRKIHIMNLDNDQMNKIIGVENAAEDSHCSRNRREENAADYPDSSQKRLTVLTPEKLNKSVREMIHDVSPTSADNFSSSSCLSTEKQTPGPRETNNVRGTSSAASPQSSSKGRLSLRRKPETGNNRIDSPLLSHFPLSYRLSIGKDDIGDRKDVKSPVSMDGELLNRLKVVRRDLGFKLIREDQSDQDMVPVHGRLKNINELEDNDGNVSGIVRQDGKSNREFTTSKKSVTKSRNVENQGRQSPVKFMQLGTLVRRRNIKYFHLGKTKHELSMPAEVPVIPVYNMQQLVSKSEAISSNPWNDSQSSSNEGENTCLTSSSNLDQAASKEFPAASCEATATSKPIKDSRLNRKKNATIVHSLNANQQSDKSIENVAEESTRSFHKMSRADKSAIHGTISHTHPGTSNSIKLLSPDEDSQLKFLKIDSPMSEREELRRASSIKSAIKGNNFPEMESSCLAASSAPGKAQEPFIESPCRKKSMRCANDRELFEDESSDRNDSVSDSSRTTIKLDRYSKLSENERSSRSDANKKRRLSSRDDQDVDVIPSVSKEQDAPRKKCKVSSSESESATHVTKNLKRYYFKKRRKRSIIYFTIIIYFFKL